MFSKYPDFARLLVQGRLGPEEGADISPLYLLINLELSPSAVRLLQSVLGALAVPMGFLVARRLFGPIAGWVALVLLTLAAPLMLYEATLEPDLLILVANLGALTVLVTKSPVQRSKMAWLAGAIFGLSAALRPSNLAVLGAAVLWLAWTARSSGSRRTLVVAGGALGCGLLTMLLPLVLVRSTVGQQLTATMSVGEMLHICNRPEGNGIGYQSPALVKLLELQERSADRPDPFHAIYRRFARAAQGSQLTPAGCERYWAERTVAFISSEPGSWTALVATKALVFLAGPDAHDVAEVRQAEQRLPVPPLLPFRWITGAGLAGLVACALRRRRVGILGPYLLAVLGVSLIFCVTSRYALMVLPAWCALAGAWVAGVAEDIRRPRLLIRSAAALVVPLGIAFSPQVRSPVRLVERGAIAGSAISDLERAVHFGRTTDARRAFVRAQAAQPLVRITRDLSRVPFEDPTLARASAEESSRVFGMDDGADAYFVAQLLEDAGDCTRALRVADLAADLRFYAAVWDVSLDPNILAATCLLHTGDRAGARSQVERALARHPGTLTGLAWATAADRTNGKRQGTAEQELRNLHDPLSAGYALGEALMTWGDPAGALEQADQVLAALPEAGVVLYLRARALAALGRKEEALVAYEKALRAFPAHGYETSPFDSLVAEALAAAPTPSSLAFGAEHSARAGRLDEARERAYRALSEYGPLAPPQLQQLGHWLRSAE
jgi:tetratricopeptide (TPR) repeat protein